jgi:beta-glucosidase
MLLRLQSLALSCLAFSSLFISSAQLVAQSAPQAASRNADSSALTTPDIEQHVEGLLRQMTLAEKVGQLVQYSFGQPTGPGTGRGDYSEMIRHGEVGSLLNVTTAKEANAFQRAAVEQSRLHIPLLLGHDVIHGFRTIFPVPLALASTWDPDIVQRAARVAARESAASGVRWTFSPMVDIARDARWGRMIEGAGEDPFLGDAMARAYVRGYQGTRLDAPDSIAACAKHFVGYGAAEGGRDYNTVEISEHTLRQFYLPPFHAAVNAGAATVMSAFNTLNGIPASANSFVLTQVLRREWGFRGLVVSDWNSVGELIPHGVANDGATAARKAILAGVDMDMESNSYHENLAQLVRTGQVPEANVDEAVRRALRVKFALGLFQHPYADQQHEAAAMLQPESVTLARTAAERSFVLLKNSAASGGGTPVLPLSASAHTIALIGPLADDATNMMGSWAAVGKDSDVVTLRAALTQRLGADHVRYAKGAEIEGVTETGFSEAVAAARQSDVVIMALGEDANKMTGEAASRAHLDLPGHQQQLLEAVVSTGKPVVLIIFSGRPLTLPWAFEHVPAVLAAWFPGVQAGPALVRTLFGESNPSGKLVVSWPRSVGQEPLHYDALSTGRPAAKINLTHPPSSGEEKYVSRYIDERDDAQFPFGFGMSFTSFQYGRPQLNTTRLSARTLDAAVRSSAPTSAAPLTVNVTITNTGARAGEEVAQLYIRFQGTSVAQPVRALRAFQRVALAAGQTRTVTFRLTPETFATWNDRNEYRVEPARVTLWVAPDSAQGQETTLDLGP